MSIQGQDVFSMGHSGWVFLLEGGESLQLGHFLRRENYPCKNHTFKCGVKMFNSARLYLALPAPRLRAEALAPHGAQGSSQESPPADAGELLTPMAEGDWPWV